MIVTERDWRSEGRRARCRGRATSPLELALDQDVLRPPGVTLFLAAATVGLAESPHVSDKAFDEAGAVFAAPIGASAVMSTAGR